MKVFANGFNLYGQLNQSTRLVADFIVVFESEVIKNFGINQFYSYFHTTDSFLLFPASNKSNTVNAAEILKVASNDDRIVILYRNGMVCKLDYNELILNRVPFLFNTEESEDRIIEVSLGSKMSIFCSKNGKLFTIASIMKFESKNIIQIECGKEHCLLLDEAGNVYSFGRGRYFLLMYTVLVSGFYAVR